MSVLAEAVATQAGLVKDPSGNLIYPEQIAAAAPEAAAAPAPVAAPRAAPAARPVTPVKATSPEADVPEPPIVGQASPADVAATKKKTLLGA